MTATPIPTTARVLLDRAVSCLRHEDLADAITFLVSASQILDAHQLHADARACRDIARELEQHQQEVPPCNT